VKSTAEKDCESEASEVGNCLGKIMAETGRIDEKLVLKVL
jgi:hypothetical protein